MAATTRVGHYFCCLSVYISLPPTLGSTVVITLPEMSVILSAIKLVAQFGLYDHAANGTICSSHISVQKCIESHPHTLENWQLGIDTKQS